MITYAHQLTAQDASYNGRPVDDYDDDINDDSLSLYFYFL